MNPRKPAIYKSLLFACLSVCLIAGGAGLARGDSSFTGVMPFDQGQKFTITPGMLDYDPRTLIVNFGEQNEVKYAKSSEEQTFDFNTLLDAPVDHPDTAEPQSVPVNKSSDDPSQQPGTIPEPSSLILLGFGLLLALSALWRRKNRN